jgi:hypothetical protein
MDEIRSAPLSGALKQYPEARDAVDDAEYESEGR